MKIDNDICLEHYEHYLYFAENEEYLIEAMYSRAMICLTNYNVLTNEQSRILNETDKKLLKRYKESGTIFNSYCHKRMVYNFFQMLEQAINECMEE